MSRGCQFGIGKEAAGIGILPCCLGFLLLVRSLEIKDGATTTVIARMLISIFKCLVRVDG